MFLKVHKTFKGTLLVITDQIVGTIADVIQENVELEGCGKF